MRSGGGARAPVNAPRHLGLVALVLLLAAFLGVYAMQVWDVDLWWHLATGRSIVAAAATDLTLGLLNNKLRPESDGTTFLTKAEFFIAIVPAVLVGLAAHHRAAEKVMPEIVVDAVEPEKRGNLRPMPDFVHQDMQDNFSGCCPEGAIHNGEIPGGIPVLRWQGANELQKVQPALPTELEECVDVVRRNRRWIR